MAPVDNPVGGTSREIPPPTPSEKQQLRADYEYVTRATYSAESVLHLVANPDAEGPVCQAYRDRDSTEWYPAKPMAVYPPGYRDWCRYCVHHWRETNSSDSGR